jgi:trehalose 6-phosphate phosphatase
VLDADATIAALTAQPEHTALLVDFDGSLSPIVERAEDARPLPEAVTQLSRCSARLGRVAVVSGRPAEFLARHLPVPGATFVGLYGMERLVDGTRTVDARVTPYLDDVAAAVADIRLVLPDDLIEPKSGVSVTLHWRPAPERADEVLAVAEKIARARGLTPLRTRMAVELRPPVAIDKGDATRALIEGFAVGAFAGDDTGDLPAFAALAAAVTDGTLDAAVRIGVHSPEAPPELADAVDVLVDGPAGLVALLARVADEIGEPHGGSSR